MSEIAYPGTDKYSMAELIVILFARDQAGPIETGRGFASGGADAMIPMATQQLLAAAAGSQTAGDTLAASNWDPRLASQAESMRSMMDTVDIFVKRGRTYRGGAFAGGMQIDKYGNLNMIGIGTWPRLKVRGPGTVGVIWSAVGPGGIWTQHHNKRVLVEKVDYVSGPGWLDGGDSRAKAYPGRDGPKRLYTPICVFDFTEDMHVARLVSVNPGYTVKDVLDNTGFTPVLPKDVPQTTPPTDYELNLLRTRVDRTGVLRRYTRLTVG
ncbi:MAG: hypothetical protein HY667_04985 [Chloroflexi bacterium]|nr:hypothetical protein [Chloroflexota bacterium]